MSWSDAAAGLFFWLVLSSVAFLFFVIWAAVVALSCGPTKGPPDWP